MFRIDRNMFSVQGFLFPKKKEDNDYLNINSYSDSFITTKSFGIDIQLNV
jgi:hypothetical protein